MHATCGIIHGPLFDIVMHATCGIIHGPLFDIVMHATCGIIHGPLFDIVMHATTVLVTHSGFPIKAAHTRTIGRWIRTELTSSGVDINTACSVRHASSSGAVKAGIPTEVIMKKAGRARESTFVQHYLKQVYSAKERTHVVVHKDYDESATPFKSNTGSGPAQKQSQHQKL